MAIVNVRFDTVTKKADITLDGQKIDNVSEVEFYIYQDENNDDTGYVDIVSREYVDDHKMVKTTRISADEQKVISIEDDSNAFRQEISKAISDIFTK